MSKSATVGGATITYREAGRGVPLVLLHGIGSAARSFEPQLAAFAGRFRVVAWDAPGYGGSTALAPPSPTARDYASALAGLMDVLAIERAHLVGHSLGALIAAAFAAENGRRVLSLTLACAAGGHARLAADERARLLDQRLKDVAELGPREMAERRGPRLVAPGTAPDIQRAVIETMAMVRPEGYVQAARMLSMGDLAADLARLPADLAVQFIHADADIITPPARIRELAAARPSARVLGIEKAGHIAYLEQPAAFNAAISEFVKSSS